MPESSRRGEEAIELVIKNDREPIISEKVFEELNLVRREPKLMEDVKAECSFQSVIRFHHIKFENDVMASNFLS